MLTTACKQPEIELSVPLEYTIGESIDLLVTGMKPGTSYTLMAEKNDAFGRRWISKAMIESDIHGEFNLDKETTRSGDFTGADVYSIFSSMIMPSPPEQDWKAPMPLDYADVAFHLISNEDTLQTKDTKQWIIPESVTMTSIREGMVAEILMPKNRTEQRPAILLLGGSGGGLAWAKRMGALLADQGYIAMALAYFNAEDLPQHLAQIPLEYLYQAIDVLKSYEGVDNDKIGILGYSKGAELGLLVASRRKDISCVAAIAPGSAVFQGFKPPAYPVISSWSQSGKELPFVPNAYDERFFQSYDGMYLWCRTLDQHEAYDQAAIPVENINGPILLISGVDDQIWPSTRMAEMIVARLRIDDFEYSYKHLAFPNAGHGIAEPPGHPTTNVSDRLGGTPEGNAQARKEMWHALLSFFSDSFYP